MGKTAKVIGGALLVLILLSLGAGGVLWWRTHGSTNKILFPDGQSFTFVGQTWGTHHEYPGELSAQKKAQATINSEEKTLCLWMRYQHPGRNYGSFDALVFDQAETGCVGISSERLYNSDDAEVSIVPILVRAYPRNEKKFKVRIQKWGNRGQQSSDAFFIVKNPEVKPYVAWPAQALPITQTNGSLSVTLLRLKYGMKIGSYNGSTGHGPANEGILTAFRVEENGQRVNNWQPISILTTDASGNIARIAMRNPRHVPKEKGLLYQWGLWPKDGPWKLKVEFARDSGFSDDELWTVKDIPIQIGENNDRNRWSNSTNAPIAEADRAGFHLKLSPIKKYGEDGPNRMADIQVTVQLDKELGEQRLTLISASDETDHIIRHYDRGTNQKRVSFGLFQTGKAKTVTLSFAIHRSKNFEFTAQPVRSQ